ncbi:hypothetical protein CASFOL_003500 [Castilleja foliolosa]|uniref:DM2 domain-containing protein n=1 Tax=Castilleja foliolosa TaxID=1961234 RepID=A0ABD3EHT2_9LAMI
MCSDFGGGGVSVGDLSELKGYLSIVGDSARGCDGSDFGGVPAIIRSAASRYRPVSYSFPHEYHEDPEDKKVIVCDEKLKKIFGGRDRVGFLEIAGLISPHFQK